MEEGNGTPLQYSCLENPMGRGAWQAAVHGATKSRTRLSDFTFTFHFHVLEKETITHFRILARRIQGTGEPGGLLSMGSHRVEYDWSDLATAAAADFHGINILTTTDVKLLIWSLKPYLMRRTDSLEKTLMLGKIEGRRKSSRGRHQAGNMEKQFSFQNPLAFHFPMDPVYSGNKLSLPLYHRALFNL